MDIATAAANVGRKVAYRPWPGAAPEEGVITSTNAPFVHVRYGADAHTKATFPRDLEFVS